MEDIRYEPLPPNQDNAHVERLIRDLTWGVWNNVWRNRFNLTGIPPWGDLELLASHNLKLVHYLSAVWNNVPPNMGLLEDQGYIRELPGTFLGGETSGYMLTDKALKGG